MFVSVILPTYNRTECLINACNSFLNQEYNSYEILVVDQSPEMTQEKHLFFSQHSAVRLFRIDKPNRCRAKNYGVQQARGEIVLICDDDIIAPRDLIQKHANHYAEQSVGAGSCRLIEEGQAVTHTNSILKVTFYGRIINNAHSLTSMKKVKTVNGGNMSFRKSLFNDVGMLDENLLGTGIMEEQDISYRIRKKGYGIFFDATTTVCHYPQAHGNASVMDTRRTEWFYSYFHNMSYCFKKNRNYYSLGAALPYVVLLALKQTVQFHMPLSSFARMIQGYFKGIQYVHKK